MGYQDWLFVAVANVVTILDTRDVDNLACPIELFDRDVRQPDVVDDTLVDKFRERVDAVGERRVRVRAVELEQIDAVDPQPVAGDERLVLQIVWVAVCEPLRLRVAQEPSFRRDDGVVRHPRLTEQSLGDPRTVGVCRVDEVDAVF
jgi:hypothetical protein